MSAVAATTTANGSAEREASRRRTFAIISHPDAGKTTLTEKLLLYAGAVNEAGAVKARSNRRSATSDWMAMERERGISISSTVLRFDYRDTVLNLLDTPGHRDFSEDTYRVLSAADAAVMLLDASKGLEPQTLKLFEVCRRRELPIITFINKYDRPGREPLELIDEIESRLDLIAAPLTWPVGIPGDFRGVVDRRDDTYIRFERTAGGATEAPERRMTTADAAAGDGDAWTVAQEELELLSAVGSELDVESFLGGDTTPVFFGSAVSNFGVRLLLDALVDLAPRPEPRPDVAGAARPLDAPFAAQVFKVQANMDARHRDSIAFARVCSGRFERGMKATVSRTGKPIALNYAHTVFAQERQALEEAFPGDVIGLVNGAELAIGDTVCEGDPVVFPPIPTFAPERFVSVHNRDAIRYKQFRRGLEQLAQEGVVQVLIDADHGEREPVLAGVGELQFEVAVHRFQTEFGAPVMTRPLRWTVARHTDAEGEALLRNSSAGSVLQGRDGARLAVFETEFQLARFERAHPEARLDSVLAI